MATFSTHIGLCALLLVMTGAAHAKDGALDSASEQALRETQEALVDPTKRAKMLEGDTKGQAFDASVKSRLGDQSEGAYQISAQVMEKLVHETKGDSKKMQEIVNTLMANPQLLESYLSPADRAKVSDMAGKIESQKGRAPAATSSY